jgi:REP element-mobilizing transposase RayT/DNA-binding Lrp family transcriptional regulator
MPRKSRIDAPGALHHIIARGIERKKIFQDDTDQNHFLERLGVILKETKTPCLAWALIPNHFHLLLKTGQTPVATLMRRFLTGYAVSFNRRHRRHGHLFQNRYKSILCQEDAYLLELVRYIHLNPMRARIVGNMEALEKYPYSGHSVILGKVRRDWQDINGVLGLYDGRLGVARRRYRVFVQEGIPQGKRPDLTGGGLIRSHGGWAVVKAMRKAKSFEKSDERILGDGDFVQEVLTVSQEHMERKYHLLAQGVDLERIASRVSDLMGMERSRIWAPGKERSRVTARSLLCYWAVRELGLSMAELSRRLGLSLSGLSQSVKRGEELVQDKGYKLIDH